MVGVLPQMNHLEMGTFWFHLYQRVIPLLDERYNPNGPVVGCGMLLRLTIGTYFITAAHVIDSVGGDFDHVGVPYGPYENGCTTLGSGTIRNSIPTPTADLDVAIFPLSADVRNRLTWECLTARDLIALRPAQAMNEFILFGYPNSTVPAFEDGGVLTVSALPVFLRTGRFVGDTKAWKPKHPDVDLFLAYGDTATDREGREVPAPALKGISGSPIWVMAPPPSSGVWSPASSLRVVAIDAGWTAPGSKNRYVVGKLWTAVQLAFARLDKRAGAEIKDALLL